jgi:hypothetical protein
MVFPVSLFPACKPSRIQKLQIKWKVILNSQNVMIQEEDIVAYLNAMFEYSDGRGMWHVWGRAEGHTGFFRLNLRERDHLRPRCRWEDNIHTGPQEIGWESTLFSYGSGQGQASGSCKQVNKLSCSIQFRAFLD